MPSKYKPHQFCSKGHDMNIVGKHSNGHCKLCSTLPKKQFCKYGHDTFICGRNKQKACRQCVRDKSRRKHAKYRIENPKVLKDIARRAYDKQREKWIAQSTQWAKDNPEKASLNQRKSKLLKHYKLTLDMYENILKNQDNKCAICKRVFIDLLHDPHVDHDHKCCPNNRSCGKCVRGLLCQGCNRALGSIKDNIEALVNSIAYLQSPPLELTSLNIKNIP